MSYSLFPPRMSNVNQVCRIHQVFMDAKDRITLLGSDFIHVVNSAEPFHVIEKLQFQLATYTYLNQSVTWLAMWHVDTDKIKIINITAREYKSHIDTKSGLIWQPMRPLNLQDLRGDSSVLELGVPELPPLDGVAKSNSMTIDGLQTITHILIMGDILVLNRKRLGPLMLDINSSRWIANRLPLVRGSFMNSTLDVKRELVIAYIHDSSKLHLCVWSIKDLHHYTQMLVIKASENAQYHILGCSGLIELEAEDCTEMANLAFRKDLEHPDSITAVALSPDKQRMAIASIDKISIVNIEINCADTIKIIANPKPKAEITAMTFSNDNQYLYIVSGIYMTKRKI